ncbi:MAG: ABC transporter permease subunit [Christensenellales bacterium]|uniref:Sugar ABC transporter permease n=1 Tax=Candidatus Avichristensenella intestinipullorum TaxID=2840693 RepID=A0A9D0YWY7_9FIRM|nr:ABC transporter permease subunit [Christensenellales bacterium]HIQ62911.1 sugar ABC transporter permease [Candidatus Avichristensenella intestinipullorum]
MTALSTRTAMSTRRERLGRYLARNWQLYLLLLPVVAYFIVFHYLPMYGLQIAFRNYSVRLGFWRSQWVGLEHFERFFRSYYSTQVIANTILISVYSLAVGMPLPILLAILMNEVRNKAFKRTVQTVTYAPYFISTVVMCSMIYLFLSPQSGVINRLLMALGGESIYFMGKPALFKTIYVLTGVWQYTGWNSIIYMAALSGIDPQLHEAAMIDGAGRFRRIWHINLPGLIPTMVILLILNSGSLMTVGFEKIFLLQNDLNRSASEVISTLVYNQGLIQHDYSYSAAVSLFNSVVNCILLVTVNQIARRVSETSLW